MKQVQLVKNYNKQTIEILKVISYIEIAREINILMFKVTHQTISMFKLVVTF